VHHRLAQGARRCPLCVCVYGQVSAPAASHRPPSHRPSLTGHVPPRFLSHLLLPGRAGPGPGAVDLAGVEAAVLAAPAVRAAAAAEGAGGAARAAGLVGRMAARMGEGNVRFMDWLVEAVGCAPAHAYEPHTHACTAAETSPLHTRTHTRTVRLVEAVGCIERARDEMHAART
jgi:hypothetical protein